MSNAAEPPAERNDRRPAEPSGSVASERDVTDRRHQARDECRVARGVAGQLQTLVTLDPGEIHSVARLDGGGEAERLVGAAAPRASTLDTQFDQRREPAGQRRAGEVSLDRKKLRE
jgi:hypothetical protein